MTDALSYALYFACGKTSGPKATRDYQPRSFLASMAGSGSITCGKTIHQAMFFCYHLEKACQIQCLLPTENTDNLILPSESICEKANNDLLGFEKDLGKRDWEAWLALLDKLHPDYKD